MFGKKKADVLVVGAGPAGLTTALTLARRGVRVHIIDKGERAGTHSYGLALHPQTLQLLEEFGLLGAVLERAIHVRRIGLYDHAERRAELRLGDLAEDYSFVAVLRQADLESILEAALEKHHVHVQWSHGLVAVDPRRTSTTVTVDTYTKDTMGYAVQHTEWVVARSRQHDYRFVVGADGIHSMVRRRLDVGFPEVAPPADFAVFEFRTDQDLADEMRLVFDDATTNVCWPMPGGFCRWSFQIPHDPALREERHKERYFGQVGGGRFPVLDQTHLQAFLAERAPWFEGSIEDIRWRMEVRFENRLADAFGKRRVWLAGDACHTTGPGGVQSLNVGLREGHELGGIVADILSGETSDDTLEDYARARRAEWRELLDIDGTLRCADDGDGWIDSIKSRLLPSVPASGDDLRRLLATVGLRTGGA